MKSAMYSYSSLLSLNPMPVNPALSHILSILVFVLTGDFPRTAVHVSYIKVPSLAD